MLGQPLLLLLGGEIYQERGVLAQLDVNGPGKQDDYGDQVDE